MSADAPTLWPFQDHWIGQIRAAFGRCRRVLGVSPTGSGKGVMLAWLAMTVATHGKRILILGHRQEIVDQISGALDRFAVPHGIIAAGQPETAAPVQIAMVLSLANRLATHAGAFDLVFADESHHSVAKTWRRILEAFPAAYVLGVTASPLRLDGQPLQDLYDELVVGPSVAELVAGGFLAPAVTFAAPVSPDLSGIRTRLGDFEQSALAARMMSSTLIGDAVEHYRKLSPQLPGLAYCVSIAHSEATAEAFNVGGYKTVHIDGETPKEERRAAIKALAEGRLDLITNCGLFSEGVDVPLLGLVIMLRPTQSLGLYLQMVGRALRIGGGKRRALILDHAGNWERHGLYDFPHQWSLEGRPKTDAAVLVRRCPSCNAVIPLRAEECPECGHVFVHRLAPPRIPQTAPGQLERIDDERWLLVQTRGGTLPYRRLLDWINGDADPGERAVRAERARRVNNYHRGWKRHVLAEAS
jgi:superfamily II DNA or RNA helicase